MSIRSPLLKKATQKLYLNKKLHEQILKTLKEIQVLYKCAHYFTFIDQIVYEIIKNQFTQPFISASLTQLCTS